MDQVNSQPSYVWPDAILLGVTAVIVIIVMFGLHALDKRTQFIERLIAIPEPTTVQLVAPNTTP